MGLANRSILDIVELVYYGPALLLSLWITKKHGLGKQAGWIYISILALLRIIGASTGIAASSNPSQDLTETSVICFSIGTTPLFFALLGLLQRVNSGIHSSKIPQRLFQLIHLPILAGLILGILGGVKSFDSDPAGRSDGAKYSKIAVIIYLCILVGLAAVTAVVSSMRRHIIDGENRLLFAAIGSIPFLFVKLIYSTVTAFDRSSTIFSLTSTRKDAVIVQAIMSVAMEMIVVAMYLAAGLSTDKISGPGKPTKY